MDILHPLLPDAHTYRITALNYDCSSKNFLQHTLDLSLEKDGMTRRLRFLAPQNLVIEQGFPLPTHGMQILDIRSRHLEQIKIEVRDMESNHGAVTFQALELVDLDQFTTS